jgi:hypothetical protein
MKKYFGNALIGALMLGTGAWVALNAVGLADIRKRRDQLHEAMTAQQVHLKDKKPLNPASIAKTADQTSEENAEIERLRAEIAKTRDTLENAMIREMVKKESKSAPRAAPVAATKKKDEAWRDSGQATPAAAINSVLWAAVNGEVKRLASLITLDAQARGIAQELFSNLPAETRAEYESVDVVIATMISGRMPPHYRNAVVVEQKEEVNGTVDVSFNLQGGPPRDATFTFKRDGAGGWRLLVPASVVAGFQKSLTGK